jgi:hypothetical protein
MLGGCWPNGPHGSLSTPAGIEDPAAGNAVKAHERLAASPAGPLCLAHGITAHLRAAFGRLACVKHASVAYIIDADKAAPARPAAAPGNFASALNLDEQGIGPKSGNGIKPWLSMGTARNAKAGQRDGKKTQYHGMSFPV